ncbi:SpoIIE family protein phosphatase [Streptomyces phytophilus]|uniref:SpoIIE family protein phosphatase n=1 Tax=Streptomyces phytophilus TaxID=722715 RepID=UPI0015F0DCBF|nr:SpoIIE family protein phosphatase [Streptomyces phytophilus]
MDTEVQAAVGQRAGTEPPCADGAHIQRHDGYVYAAVCDGAGHAPDTVAYANLAPAVITHTSAVVGGLAAMITAGQMAHAYDTPPHVSAVTARMAPDGRTWLYWIGDCRAYGWDGQRLAQHTTDQTLGEFLRLNGGVPEDIARRHDNWFRLGLWQATSATVMEGAIPAETGLVLLTTDGIHDQIPHGEMERLATEHEGDPQALADALTAAAPEDDGGYRDDATVIVLRRHTPKENRP